jgi:hypothetical protein
MNSIHCQNVATLFGSLRVAASVLCLPSSDVVQRAWSALLFTRIPTAINAHIDAVGAYPVCSDPGHDGSSTPIAIAS